MKITYDYLVEKAVNCLVKENTASPEDVEIYRFGVEVTFLKTMHLFSDFLIAVCMKKVPEFLIIFGIFCAFRRNTGGYHAKTRVGCYVFSCLAVAAALEATEAEVRLLYICMISLCEAVILILISPVENENRPLDEEEISCFKKRLYILTAIYFTALIITIKMGYFQLLWLFTIGLSLTTILTLLGKFQEERTPGGK